MQTIPRACKDMRVVSAFCDCIAKDGGADPAAQAFCARAGDNPSVTGEDLEDLKKALMDLEDEGGSSHGNSPHSR